MSDIYAATSFLEALSRLAFVGVLLWLVLLALPAHWLRQVAQILLILIIVLAALAAVIPVERRPASTIIGPTNPNSPSNPSIIR